MDRRSDFELLRAPARDMDAFAAFYRRHVRDVIRLVARRAEPSDVGDLVAEVFATALVHRRRYDPSRGAAGAWLAGIALNKLSDAVVPCGRRCASARRGARVRAGDPQARQPGAGGTQDADRGGRAMIDEYIDALESELRTAAARRGRLAAARAPRPPAGMLAGTLAASVAVFVCVAVGVAILRAHGSASTRWHYVSPANSLASALGPEAPGVLGASPVSARAALRQAARAAAAGTATPPLTPSEAWYSSAEELDSIQLFSGPEGEQARAAIAASRSVDEKWFPAGGAEHELTFTLPGLSTGGEGGVGTPSDAAGFGDWDAMRPARPRRRRDHRDDLHHHPGVRHPRRTALPASADLQPRDRDRARRPHDRLRRDPRAARPRGRGPVLVGLPAHSGGGDLELSGRSVRRNRPRGAQIPPRHAFSGGARAAVPRRRRADGGIRGSAITPGCRAAIREASSRLQAELAHDPAVIRAQRALVTPPPAVHEIPAKPRK